MGTQEEKELVLSESFNVHDYAESPKRERLIPLCVYLFEHLNFLEIFNVQRAKFVRFVLTVASKYRDVPYHNFTHAFDVTQTAFVYLTRNNVMNTLLPVDAFSLLLSCIVHDLDHMGLNNSFHTKVETPLGLLSNAFGTTSVLEVHHCNLTLEILANEATGILDGMRKDDKRTCYKNLLSNILATDMAQHKRFADEFLEKCGQGYDAENLDHRRAATMMLIKCADVSNITKVFNISRLWAIAVTTEFYAQGDKEKEMGCSVTPNFNRDTKPELAQTQIGFIDFVGVPFFTLVSSVFKDMEVYIDRMKSNRHRWDQLLNQQPAIPRKSIF